MTNDVPFTQVQKMLEGVGFRAADTRGVNHTFVHPQRDVRFVVPVFEGMVKSVYVSGMARLLDETGILDRDAFAGQLARANGKVVHS